METKVSHRVRLMKFLLGQTGACWDGLEVDEQRQRKDYLNRLSLGEMDHVG